MKLLWKFIRKIIISAFVLYIFNYFFIHFDFVIPINVFTLSFVSIFDFFGLIGLVLFKIFVL